VLFKKRHGGQLHTSVLVYDKRRRVAQMRQGNTLTPLETEAVCKFVRLDITAHSIGIESIVAAARSWLKGLREKGAGGNPTWLNEFMTGEPKSTVWWLERAVNILSHRMDGDRTVRRSFAKWLVPHIVKDVLRLDVISSFSTKGFHALTKLNDEIAAAWRASDLFDGDWAIDLANRSNCSRKTVYRRRRHWFDEYGINIELPYAFYRDLLFYGRNSVASPEARSAVVDAVDRGDGAKVVRAQSGAAQDFDKRRRAVLTTTIQALPHSMEVRVIAPPDHVSTGGDRRGRLRPPSPASR
jgi:hypothetical protein